LAEKRQQAIETDHPGKICHPFGGGFFPHPPMKNMQQLVKVGWIISPKKLG